MDSFVGEDPAHPGMASDGDSLLDAEITLGNGNLLELHDGSIPVMPKSSTGRMSPIRSHTMKDFEQQLADFKKENFNLKLRIYYLEQRVERKWDVSGEDLIKTNIELKVDVETLKADLLEKADLLTQAASTVDSLRVQHQTDIAKARAAGACEADERVRELETRLALDADERVSRLEAQLAAMAEDAERATLALAEAREKLALREEEESASAADRWREDDDADSALTSPKVMEAGKRRTLELSPSPDSDKDSGAHITEPHPSGAFLDEAELQLLERKASLLELLVPCTTPSSNSERLERDVARVAEELRLGGVARERLDFCQCGAAAGKRPERTLRELEALAEDHELAERSLENRVAELKAELADRRAALEAADEKLRQRDKEREELTAANDKMETQVASDKEAAAKGHKAIQGLSKLVHEREREIKDLQTTIEEAAEEKRLLAEQMASMQSRMQRDKDAEARDKSDRQIRTQELEDFLRDKKLEIERLHKSNERKEKELVNLNEQLDSLEERLRETDLQVQDMREELRNEKQKANDRADATQQHFQTLLEEAQRESTNKDRLINKLSRSLKDRDDSLADFAEASALAEGAGGGGGTPSKQMETINKLKERLKDRDKAVEDALAEKFASLEEKEEETRAIRRQLREREREGEKANALLMATEETMDALERDIEEKEGAALKLTTELKEKERILKEKDETHAATVKELETTVDGLNRALEATNRLVPLANDSDEAVAKLREALVEKDRFIQDLLKERAEAAKSSDETAQKLVQALSEKDDDLKVQFGKEEKERAELTRRIQELTSDLNRKQFELEKAETRSQWNGEQLTDTIAQLRQALKEKDDVIQSLIESGRGKDVLLCATGPGIRDPDVEEKMKEIRIGKEKAEKENRKLKKQMAEKEAELKSVRSASEKQKKDLTLANSKVEDLENEINRIRQSLKEKEASLSVDDARAIRDELNALKKALESAGLSAFSDPQKLQIEIGHVIRRASVGNGGMEKNMNSKEKEGYALLRDAAERERDAYLEMASTIGGCVMRDDAVEALRRLQEELEKVAQLRHNLEGAVDAAKEKASPKKTTPSKFKRPGKGGKSPTGSRSQISEEASTASTVSTAGPKDAMGQAVVNPNAYDDPARLHRELRLKEKELQQREEENQSLREQLILQHQQSSPRLSSSDDASTRLDSVADISLSSAAPSAATASAALDPEETKAKVKKLKKKLKAADRLIELLKRQIQLNQGEDGESKFDPQLIVELAAEIERLKSDLEEAKEKSKSTAQSSSPSKSPSKSGSRSSLASSPVSKPPSGKSLIPIRSKSSETLATGLRPSSQDKLEQAQHLESMKELNERLRKKLASTEATVRHVAKKAKHYRSLLEESGAISSSPHRSSSESMLDRLLNESSFDQPLNDSLDGFTPERRLSDVSLVNEEDLPANQRSKSFTAANQRRDSEPRRMTWSAPSLLPSNDVEKLAFEARESQDVGFLKSSVETLVDQLHRHSATIGDLRQRLPSTDDASKSLDDTATLNRNAFDALQRELDNVKCQLAETHSENQSLQRQLLEATLPIDGASDVPGADPETRASRDVPASARSATGEDLREREIEILGLKKKIADAHNLCQCLKDSADDLSTQLDASVDTQTPTEDHVIAPNKMAALRRQAAYLRKTSANLARVLGHDAESVKDDEEDEDQRVKTDSEIYALEEANADLREEVERLAAELQSATSLHSAWEQQMTSLEAEAAELHAEVGALRNLLNEKNAQNTKYRGILSENQAAASQARDELERLVEEVKGKDILISQLHQKLKKAQFRLQEAQTAGNTIYSTTEDEDEARLNGTPRGGRNAPHPPRPHRKVQRHRTPSSASEGEWAQEAQQQLQHQMKNGWRAHGNPSGSREEEEETPAEILSYSDVLPAVGVGFPSVDDSFSISGPGIFGHSLSRQHPPTKCASTQSDPPPNARSPQTTIFPTPDASSASSDVTVPPLPAFTAPFAATSSPPSNSAKSTQTELDLALELLRQLGRSPQTAPLVKEAVAAQPSQLPPSTRKCLFPDNSNKRPYPDGLDDFGEASTNGSSNDDDTVRQAKLDPRVDALREKLRDQEILNRALKEEIESLAPFQARLRDSELLNRTLKEELEVLNSIVATFDDSKEELEGQDPASVLQGHLEEMRRLRKQLENQMQTHRDLGDNIEERLKNRPSDSPTSPNLRTDIFLTQNSDHRTSPVVEAEIPAAVVEEMSRLRDDLAAAVAERQDLASRLREADDLLRRSVDQISTKDEANRKLKAKQKEATERLAAVEASNEELRRDASAKRLELKAKEEELTTTRIALKETKDLVNAVRNELGVLTRLKKDRRERRAELDLGEYLKEMDALRDRLKEAVEENQRLRRRLEDFQVVPSTSTKASKDQEVHVHHDCASVGAAFARPPTIKDARVRSHSSHRGGRAGGGRAAHARRGSDSGLWSISGINGGSTSNADSNGVGATTGTEESGLNEILNVNGFPLTPTKKLNISSSSSSKNDSSYVARDDEKKVPVPRSALRFLFAVGRVDDFELMKKEVAEAHAVVEALEVAVKRRREELERASPSKHPEFGLLRRIENGFSNLSTLLTEVQRLVNEFWTSTLPAEGGGVFEMLENVDDPDDVLLLKNKLKNQDRLLREAISRLEATNRMKEGFETHVVKKLSNHYKVLKEARNNLENVRSNSRGIEDEVGAPT